MLLAAVVYKWSVTGRVIPRTVKEEVVTSCLWHENCPSGSVFYDIYLCACPYRDISIRTCKLLYMQWYLLSCMYLGSSVALECTVIIALQPMCAMKPALSWLWRLPQRLHAYHDIKWLRVPRYMCTKEPIFWTFRHCVYYHICFNASQYNDICLDAYASHYICLGTEQYHDICFTAWPYHYFRLDSLVPSHTMTLITFLGSLENLALFTFRCVNTEWMNHYGLSPHRQYLSHIETSHMTYEHWNVQRCILQVSLRTRAGPGVLSLL